VQWERERVGMRRSSRVARYAAKSLDGLEKILNGDRPIHSSAKVDGFSEIIYDDDFQIWGDRSAFYWRNSIGLTHTSLYVVTTSIDRRGLTGIIANRYAAFTYQRSNTTDTLQFITIAFSLDGVAIPFKSIRRSWLGKKTPITLAERITRGHASVVL